MPVLPTISNVYRITLDWNTNVGITPRNVFHVRKSGSNEVEVAEIIKSGAADHMFAPLSAGWDCPELAILKLDGSSATQFFPVDSGTFLGGTTGSDVIPQAAIVVSFHTTQRGPRGRGRMYVGPISENQQAQGAANTTTTADMAVAWAEFISNLDGDGCPMVVASYVHADAHDVITFNIDSLIGTQRRRLDQLR